MNKSELVGRVSESVDGGRAAATQAVEAVIEDDPRSRKPRRKGGDLWLRRLRTRGASRQDRPQSCDGCARSGEGFCCSEVPSRRRIQGHRFGRSREGNQSGWICTQDRQGCCCGRFARKAAKKAAPAKKAAVKAVAKKVAPAKKAVAAKKVAPAKKAVARQEGRTGQEGRSRQEGRTGQEGRCCQEGAPAKKAVAKKVAAKKAAPAKKAVPPRRSRRRRQRRPRRPQRRRHPQSAASYGSQTL